MAARATNADHRAMLAKMAETWEALAQKREEKLAREERLAALEAGISAK